MPKQYPSEVRERAVRMVLERLGDYGSAWAACQDIAPKLDVGPESLRKWVVQAQTDSSSLSELAGESHTTSGYGRRRRRRGLAS